jgi:hypothetical protein
MSDKRLEELGLPRRTFLKRLAAAGFVAPVVASFGLDGVAQAHQYCANQTSQQIYYQNQTQQYYQNQTHFQNQNGQGQNNDCQGQNSNSQ